LVGHSKTLTALAFGNKSQPKLLVSAAEDYVIVWNIQQARQLHEKGNNMYKKVLLLSLKSIYF